MKSYVTGSIPSYLDHYLASVRWIPTFDVKSDLAGLPVTCVARNTKTIVFLLRNARNEAETSFRHKKAKPSVQKDFKSFLHRNKVISLFLVK